MGKIKWADGWEDSAEEGLDENVRDIVLSLNENGYPTAGNSCEGGHGHLYSVGFIGLDKGFKLTPRTRRELENIISIYTPVPFRVIKNNGWYSIVFKDPLGSATGRWTPEEYKDAYEGYLGWDLAPDKWKGE